jgi:hypothetical protein
LAKSAITYHFGTFALQFNVSNELDREFKRDVQKIGAIHVHLLWVWVHAKNRLLCRNSFCWDNIENHKF